MSDTTISLKIVIDGKDALGTLSLTQDNLKNLSSAFKGMGETAQSQFDKFGGRIVAVNQGFEALSKAVSVLSKPIEIAGNFEKYATQFEVLLGSADAAKNRMKELADFANTTPFELPEVVKASKLLQTFGGSALATGSNLTLVGDMASAAGVGFEEIAMWVGRANTQIMSGRQWGEAAMRLQELGLMSGQTRQRLEDLSKSGASNEVVWKEFTKSMGGFSGMMDKQSKTLQGVMSTMSDSLNMILADIGNAFLPALKDAAKIITGFTDSIKDMPASLKVVGAAVAALAGTYMMFNSSISPLWYVLIGVGGAIATLSTAIKEGNQPMITITAAVIGLSVAIGAMAIKSAFASGEILTKLIPSISALGVTSLATAGLIGAIGAGLAVFVVKWEEVFTHAKGWQDKFNEAWKRGTKESVDEAIEDYKRLSREKRMLTIGDIAFDIESDKKKLKALEGSDSRPMGKDESRADFQIRTRDFSTKDLTDTSNQIEGYKKLIGIREGLLAAALKAEKGISVDAQKKLNAELSEGDKNAAELRLQNIQDAKARELAILDDKYGEEKKKYAGHAGALEQLRIKHKNDTDKINADYAAKESQEAADHEKRMAEITFAGLNAQLDNEEKLSLATATTESERLRITRDFALRRIEIQKAEQLQSLDIERQRINKLPENAERTVKINENTDAMKKVTTDATNKTSSVNTTYTTGIETVKKDLSVVTGNDEIKKEQERMLKLLSAENLTQKERQRIIEDSEQRISDIKDNAHLDNLNAEKEALQKSLTAIKGKEGDESTGAKELEKKITALEIQIGDVSVEQAKRATNAHKESYDERIERYRRESATANITANAIGAGFSQMWQDSILVHRQAASKEDAVWLAMENTALSAIGNILQKQIESWAAEGVAFLATSAGKQAVKATETTVMVSGDAAQSASATSTAGVQAAANATETGSSLIAAVANGIKSVMALTFPLNILAAVGIGATVYGAFQGAKKLLGFATGGLVRGEGGPTDDKIPAMLSNGEFVVREKETRANAPLLNAINTYGGDSYEAVSIMHSMTNNSPYAKSIANYANSLIVNNKPEQKTEQKPNAVQPAAGDTYDGATEINNSSQSTDESVTTNKFFSGGFVSGEGGATDDKIPAMLSNGEFVINAKATQKTLPLLRSINTYGGDSQQAYKEFKNILNKNSFAKSIVNHANSTIINNKTEQNTIGGALANIRFADGGFVGRDMPEIASMGMFDLPQFADGGFVVPDMSGLKYGIRIPDMSFASEAARSRSEALGRSPFGGGTEAIEKKLDELIERIVNMENIITFDGREVTKTVESVQKKNSGRRY